MTRIWLAACGLFFASGFAALVLETVLLRRLALWFGNSAVATSLVLAAFMGGLALGAALFGRSADRASRPLRLFGYLELGTAISAALVLMLLGSARHLLLPVLGAIGPPALRQTLELVIAFGLVLIPASLMGGTLPALSRLMIRDLERYARNLGLLYGINTLGAALGVFCAGFVLFEWLGIALTGYAAIGIQLAVAGLALLLDRSEATACTAPGPTTTPAEGAEDPGASDEASHAPHAGMCILAAAAGGFAVLGYEVAWARALSLFMRSFSYSFSLMLFLFLIGLVAGAMLLALVAPRIQRPVSVLGWVQLMMGLYVALSVWWLPGFISPIPAKSFEQFLLHSVLRAVPIVVPVTVLSGLVLPLAAGGAAWSLKRVGRTVGLVYGLNTAGAITGALLTGLVLMPQLGAPRSLAVLAAVNATCGLVVLWGSRHGIMERALAGVLVVICLLPIWHGREAYVEAFLKSTRNADTIGELLFFHEGATDTVAVVRRTYGIYDPDAKSLITNGVAMSATVKPVWRYMAAEGHLPVLISQQPQRALTIGIGTGITLAAIVSHRDVSSVTAVELSEGVLRGLEHFESENELAYRSPKVQLLRDDGRHFLELTSEHFGVITVEPPPPIVAGAGHLYSKEFYELCSRRLTAGGVVAQWLPLHAQSLASAKMTARTFLDAFPHVTLWLPSVRDAVLIGSHVPQVMDYQRVQAAFQDPQTRANLEQAYLESPAALLATLMLDRSGVRAWAGEALPITDDHPRMEFFRNQGANMKDQDIAALLDPPQAGWGWVTGLSQQPGLLNSVQRENFALRNYILSRSTRNENAGLLAIAASLQTEFFRYPFGCTSRQLAPLLSAPDSPTTRGQLQRCQQLQATVERYRQSPESPGPADRRGPG